MTRKWDEVYRLGTALAASPYVTRAEFVAGLRDLERHFEVPQTVEEKAFGTVLGGIIAVIEAEAVYPSNSGDDV
jgi:hypothetical protein